MSLACIHINRDPCFNPCPAVIFPRHGCRAKGLTSVVVDTLHYCIRYRSQVSTSQEEPIEAIPTCKKWSEADGGWDSEGLTVNAVGVGFDGTAGTSCRTYHLSTFSTWEDSLSGEWNTVDLLTGHNVLIQVGHFVTQYSRHPLSQSNLEPGSNSCVIQGKS